MSFIHSFDEMNNIDLIRGPVFETMIRRRGAEVIGLTWKNQQSDPIGLLWRNGQLVDPPRWWKNHATILFPIVGGIHDLQSTTTQGDKIRFKKQHGFARHSVFALLQARELDGGFEIVYRLEANEETRAMYPWKFSLTIAYLLSTNRLQQTMTVANRDRRPMPFQLGWHPGFNTPFIKGEKSGCHLRLPRGRTVMLLNDDNCYLTGEKRNLDLSGDFQFSEDGLDRTYMLDLSTIPPASRIAELRDPDEQIGIRLHFPD